MTCKLCGHSGVKLVKAHIIPQSFYRVMAKDPDYRYVPPAGSGRPVRSRTGIYDKTIVCEGCEKLFDPLDDYGCKFLIKQSALEQLLVSTPRQRVYCRREFDFRALKLFAISLAWRSSATKHPLFSKVSLGPYEAVAARCILESSIGDDSVFPVILMRRVGKLSTIIQNPGLKKVEGVNFLVIYLGGYELNIKIDKRAGPADLDALYLREGQPAIIGEREFAGTREFKELARTVRLQFGNKRAR